jgi:hypothetical protein
MPTELQTMEARAGAAVTSAVLAWNFTTLAMMQDGVAGRAFAMIPRRMPLPVSKVGDKTKVDTGSETVAGTVEAESGNYRVVAGSDGNYYFQEWHWYNGWQTVSVNGSPVKCSEQAWQKKRWGAFSSGSMDMSNIGSQLNLPGFQSSFRDRMMNSVRESIMDKIRDPFGLLGNVNMLPASGERMLLSVGRTDPAAFESAPIVALDPGDIEMKIWAVLCSPAKSDDQVEMEIVSIGRKYLAKARELVEISAQVARA